MPTTSTRLEAPLRPPRPRAILVALLLICCGLLCTSDHCFAEVEIPSLTSPVTDLTNTLSADQQNSLRQDLLAFEREKGSQLVLLVVPSTQPESIEQYSLRVVEQWKIGRKRVDDGVLLIVAKDDRKLRIEVGYGLEGALNDAIAKRIIEEQIKPFFKAGDYYAGISVGLMAIQKIIKGEALPPASWQGNAGGPDPDSPGIFILFGLVPLLSIFRPKSPRNRAILAGIGSIIAFAVGAVFFGLLAGALISLVVFPLVYLGAIGGVRSSSGSSSGGRSYSGGGGSFGGGGSSGSW